MDRKNFLKKALSGAGMIAAGSAVAAFTKNNIDELKPLDLSKQVGFNHHPGHATVMNENTVLHKAQTRGNADYGWLKTNYSFSFANYYNPDRMNFGALRVLNDDFIAAAVMMIRYERTEVLTVRPLQWWMYPLAFVIGGVSGLTGIGGGIYLAPFLYLTKWGSPKQIAGASSVFILINSLAGLSAQVAVNGWQPEAKGWPLMVAVLIGGLLGSQWSSARFSHRIVRYITIVIIIVAAIRILLKYL